MNLDQKQVSLKYMKLFIIFILEIKSLRIVHFQEETNKVYPPPSPCIFETTYGVLRMRFM